MPTRILALSLVCVFLATGSAFSQDVILYRPVVQPFAPAPIVPAPVVVARPAYTNAYPVAAAPVMTSPVVVQRPMLYETQSVAPVVSYSPAIPAAYAAPVVPAPVAVSPVVVRPKVYIPGRPIYNFFEAITP
ncbi:hypothetical protein SH528x_004826 [Novipirellula sp. SH528]|uniref:hypothetical protein n=1 Tax=Novipirellula sp. SH528 TaxID=3454466 RepID=UPI003FA102BC